jgi:hypothetical protein
MQVYLVALALLQTNSPSTSIVQTSPLAPSRIANRPAGSTAPPVLLDVRVSSGAGDLWQGSLRTGQAGASLTHHRSESEAEGCPDQPAYDKTIRHQLTVNIHNAGAQPTGAAYHVSVSWQRPASPQGCASDGMRTVQIQQTIGLPPGAQAMMQGGRRPGRAHQAQVAGFSN